MGFFVPCFFIDTSSLCLQLLPAALDVEETWIYSSICFASRCDLKVRQGEERRRRCRADTPVSLCSHELLLK